MFFWEKNKSISEYVEEYKKIWEKWEKEWEKEEFFINPKSERDSFKKKIVGIFQDWTVKTVGRLEEYIIVKDDYCLWIGLTHAEFQDWNANKSFLSAFKDWEKQILWQEARKRIHFKKESSREAVFAEFNLK